MTLAVRVRAATRGLSALVSRLRRDALGMNRRNVSFLVPYNPRPLFALVDHKPSTKERLAREGIPVPVTFAELTRAWDIRRLGALLAPHGDFVIKPARGAGGGGVLVISGRDGDDFVKASGERLGLRALEDHCLEILGGAFARRQHSDQVLVEYRVRPDSVLGGISYCGVPDVRVLVFRGVPVQAMLRLPTRASDGRANLHMGGMGVGIDLVDGTTVHAVLDGVPRAVHPELGRSVLGVRVPCWDTLLEIAARCFDAVPLGFLGVDLVLDAILGPLVLELNGRPGLTIQLANGRGLRRRMEELERRDVRGLAVRERIALGRALERQ